jgi:hypothetical protein
MKIKNVQGIIFLVLFFLFANQTWAEEWIYYGSSSTRDKYYDKSSIVISVWTQEIFNEDGKKEAFSFLESVGKAPGHLDIISHVFMLKEIDCLNKKIKDASVIIYDENNNVLYSSPKGETDKWNDIMPNSVGEKLKNTVCKEPVTTDEAIIVSSAVTYNNLAQVNSKQNKIKYTPEEAVRNLVTKWLSGWKSGDMETYRSCYASDFQSKGMNLDAWVSRKNQIHQKSKNKNINIDKLQISASENNATAVFTQSYSSSIFEYYSGTKKLELRKIYDEWKIYREIM